MTLLFFTLIFSFSLHVDPFYEKELIPLDIKGKVIEKQLKEDYYVVKVLQDDGSLINFKLLKRKVEREIYWFIIEGSIIKKKSGKCDLHVLTPTPAGGYKGRIFDQLCE